MGSLKKQIQAALKLHSMKMHFYDIETRYKNDSIIFISQKSEIGCLGYTFVSSKFAEFGSQLGMYISCRFGQEMKNSLAIIRLIDNLNLSYKAGQNCLIVTLVLPHYIINLVNFIYKGLQVLKKKIILKASAWKLLKR